MENTMNALVVGLCAISGTLGIIAGYTTEGLLFYILGKLCLDSMGR
jgi:hypothetical protein